MPFTPCLVRTWSLSLRLSSSSVLAVVLKPRMLSNRYCAEPGGCNQLPSEADDNAVTRWDAGHLGCGELVMELRGRLAPLTPGSLFALVALDPGAPADLPAWCRMTGHQLAKADHPNYIIRRRPKD